MNRIRAIVTPAYDILKLNSKTRLARQNTVQFYTSGCVQERKGHWRIQFYYSNVQSSEDMDSENSSYAARTVVVWDTRTQRGRPSPSRTSTNHLTQCLIPIRGSYAEPQSHSSATVPEVPGARIKWCLPVAIDTVRWKLMLLATPRGSRVECLQQVFEGFK